MIKLLSGLHHFKEEIYEVLKDFFTYLAHNHHPEVIFVTCSDARVVPNLLTQTAPGELFTVRNAGNIVPDHHEHSGAEEAAIEFAVTQLGVKEIVVCGHSQCGAMRGLLNPENLSNMPAMSKWLGYADKTARILKENYSHVTDKEALLNIAVQENVLVQLENISSLPCIAKKLSKREIELHGWVWKIETGQVFVYDHINEEFRDSAALSDDFESMTEAEMKASSVAGRDLLKTALRKAKPST